jgi:oxygen-independent coproporphyrinogen-3 oxidase
LQEIRNRHTIWPDKEIATLYFGGGTPRLIAPDHMVSSRDELANVGFSFRKDAEITIEINPATLTREKLDVYLGAGINRFSVGAQSFNDDLLRLCGRKHSAADTRETLALLRGFNYSFDLLFALPGQTREDLARDLDEVAEFSPPHLSAYCLTVPEGHPLSAGRPPEGDQVAMFDQIETALSSLGLMKYEISNFAKPGFESRHNGVYWNDQDYWGVGLSSHSYARTRGAYGTRFWNPKSLKLYAEQVERSSGSLDEILLADQFEQLQAHEALTDLCHIFLRTSQGLPDSALRYKFPVAAAMQAEDRLERLVRRRLLAHQGGYYRLTAQGSLISNKVFEELTFLAEDLNSSTLTRAYPDSY